MTNTTRNLVVAVLTGATFTSLVVAVCAIILQSWTIIAVGALAIALGVVAIPILIGIGVLFDRLLGGH